MRLTPRFHRQTVALQQHAVDEHAFRFADELRRALLCVDVLGNAAACRPWSTDDYLETVLLASRADPQQQPRPILYTAPERGDGYHARLVLLGQLVHCLGAAPA